MNRKMKFFVIIMILAMIIGGCGQKTTTPVADQPKKEPFELKWGTIAAGGTWQIIGNAMLEDVKKANSDITGSCLPGSSATNMVGVQEGKFNIAFGATDNTIEAWEGTGQFAATGKIDSIRQINANFPFTTHIVVRKDSGINTIEDLRGKRISPGAKGVSGDTQMQRLLKLYGMSYDDMKVEYLNFNDAAQQFVDGHIDCLSFVTVPPPFPAVVNVSTQRDIKLLSIPDDKIAELSKYPGVTPYTMQGGIYKGVDYEVKGIKSVSHIVVHKDMPDDIVYKITKTLAENHERYNDVLANWKYVKKEDIAADIGIPYHPGAIKYYKEIGLMK